MDNLYFIKKSMTQSRVVVEPFVYLRILLLIEQLLLDFGRVRGTILYSKAP